MGSLWNLIVDFQAFDSFASLIPPPLVDLGLSHASPLGNFDDLLPRPKEITASQLILQNWELLLSFSFAFSKHFWAVVQSIHNRLLLIDLADLLGLSLSEHPFLRRWASSIANRVMRLVFFFHRRLVSLIIEQSRFFGWRVFHQFLLQFLLSVILKDSLETQIDDTCSFLELVLDLGLLLRQLWLMMTLLVCWAEHLAVILTNHSNSCWSSHLRCEWIWSRYWFFCKRLETSNQASRWAIVKDVTSEKPTGTTAEIAREKSVDFITA